MDARQDTAVTLAVAINGPAISHLPHAFFQFLCSKCLSPICLVSFRVHQATDRPVYAATDGESPY